MRFVCLFVRMIVQQQILQFLDGQVLGKMPTVKLLINAPGVYSNNRQIPRHLAESWRARVVVVRVESN